MDPAATLRAWLERRLDEEARTWLLETTDALAAGAPDRRFFLAFSSVPRRAGDAPLVPTAEERAEAETARPGWNPRAWTVADAARALLLLARADPDAIEQAFRAADLGELVALYRALPLLPEPQRWRARCAEGVRTNMTAVFRAVAHDNPYPSEQLDPNAWNQLVLKALFVGVELDPVVGLDERANEELARMLRDYAHERWAAGRPVSPELWRCVGPFAADDASLADLERALAGGCEGARAALERAPHPKAPDLIKKHRRP